MRNKGIIFDRDGTLIKYIPYLKNVKKEFLTLENLYLDILKDKQNKEDAYY